MGEKYLSPNDISNKYGIPASTIYWLKKTNKIPHVKLGKKLLIPEQKFLRFLAENTFNPIDEFDIEI
ncbi:MAG: helix-turn-helix domain-containing protein [Candidatus Dadabacteria bacterium]|nr:helix-turn-helix domain-containing protein [Candidatus Dadabacteria bacterium]NIQ14440.1 helix-turn-helix domain-containing protein [Candidatus Dadabacteria bacterium]